MADPAYQSSQQPLSLRPIAHIRCDVVRRSDVNEAASPKAGEFARSGEGSVRVIAAGHYNRSKGQHTARHRPEISDRLGTLRAVNIGRSGQQRAFGPAEKLGRSALGPVSQRNASQAVRGKDDGRPSPFDFLGDPFDPVAELGCYPVLLLHPAKRCFPLLP